VRQVYEDYLSAITQIAKCQARMDCSSKLYEHLRKKIDELSPQLNEVEREDAYWFALSLDRPREGAVYLKDGDGDEDEDRSG
jgi:hypothetical protein